MAGNSVLFAQIDSLQKLETLQIKENDVTLQEVVISADRLGLPIEKMSQKVDILSSKSIQWMNVAHTAELLHRNGQISVQMSQGGGGSPVIRGFEANKVLIEIDGVRLNNAIFRGGHLQNVLRIDNAMLARLEVLYGPSSTVHGSDALGGVMSFYTKNPILSKKPTGSAFLRYASATGEKAGHFDFNIGSDRFASLTSVTFTDFDDIVTGKNRNSKYPDFGKRPFYVERIDGKDSMKVNPNVNKQVGTAYRQLDIYQKFRFIQNEKNYYTLNFQYSNTGNVPRYDRLTEVGSNGMARQAEWYYGPEQRILGSLQYTHRFNKRFAEQMLVILSYQNLKESRHSRRFNSSNRKSQEEQVSVYSLDVDFNGKVGKHSFHYGLENYLNQVQSKAHSTNISSNVESPADTRYPNGGSMMNTFAVFAQDYFNLSSKFILNGGLRFNATQLHAKFTDTTFFAFPFTEAKQNNLSLTGNLGTKFNLSPDTKFNLMFSTGFRNPNVDDLAKVFESAGSRLIIPNEKIKPEYTGNAEFRFEQRFFKKVNLDLGAYYTQIFNAIVVDKFQYNGQDSVLYDGNMAAVYANQNKRKAKIYGFYGTLGTQLIKGFSFYGSVNYTYGRVATDTTDIPLDHIPPLTLGLSLHYRWKRLHTEFFVQAHAKKDIKDYLLGAEDNEIYATPDGMPAWQSLNLRVGYTFTKWISAQIGCDNLLDQHYRVFASGTSAPGRNFKATLRFQF